VIREYIKDKIERNHKYINIKEPQEEPKKEAKVIELTKKEEIKIKKRRTFNYGSNKKG
jgi:hypothetical protein